MDVCDGGDTCNLDVCPFLLLVKIDPWRKLSFKILVMKMYQKNLYYSYMSTIQKAYLICELELEIW